jgi:hypothetical protein
MGSECDLATFLNPPTGVKAIAKARWSVVVNNRGLGVTEAVSGQGPLKLGVGPGSVKTWFPWSSIVSFGVNPGTMWAKNGYLWMTIKKPDGKSQFVILHGLRGEQVILAVLRNIHERKVGRYIYPRVRAQLTAGERILAMGAAELGWEDKGKIPEGKPPPIVAFRGFERQFASANEAGAEANNPHGEVGIELLYKVIITVSCAVANDDWSDVLESLPDGSMGSWPEGATTTAQYVVPTKASTPARAVDKVVGIVTTAIKRVPNLRDDAYVSASEVEEA